MKVWNQFIAETGTRLRIFIRGSGTRLIQIGVTSGPAMAANDTIRITIQGHAAHGARAVKISGATLLRRAITVGTQIGTQKGAEPAVEAVAAVQAVRNLLWKFSAC